MIKYNTQMEKILLSSNKQDNKTMLKTEVESLIKLFNQPFQKVYDCIIISDDEIDLTREKFDKMIVSFLDCSGFEYAESEIRINDYIQNIRSAEVGVQIALIVIEFWYVKLREIDSQSKFGFIISCDKEYVTLRYHKVRKNDIEVLDENFEDFNQPIYYAVK